MADTKISEFTQATAVALTDIIPIIQTGANKKATLSQLKTLSNTPLVGIVTNAAIPLSYELVSVSGACTIPNSTVDGTKITLVATGVGSLSGTGISYSFVQNSTISIVWLNSIWYILSVYSMTPI